MQEMDSPEIATQIKSDHRDGRLKRSDDECYERNE